jgi:hypothetical protein
MNRLFAGYQIQLCALKLPVRLSAMDMPDKKHTVGTPIVNDNGSISVVVVEEQLASIIVSARNVAVIAEELLREVATIGENDSTPGKLQQRLNVAPRLLAATEQQLESLLMMLRMT